MTNLLTDIFVKKIALVRRAANKKRVTLLKSEPGERVSFRKGAEPEIDEGTLERVLRAFGITPRINKEASMSGTQVRVVKQWLSNIDSEAASHAVLRKAADDGRVTLGNIGEAKLNSLIRKARQENPTLSPSRAHLDVLRSEKGAVAFGMSEHVFKDMDIDKALAKMQENHPDVVRRWSMIILSPS